MAEKKKAQAKPEITVQQPAKVPAWIRALEGDNYLTIAERYDLDPATLLELNGGAPVLTGGLIVLQ